MPAKLPKRKPRSLADQVYEYLRGAILMGDITQGEKIVELDIADQMGTSQGPVREALQRLSMEGLVERHARSATYVIELGQDEMYELFTVRGMIEGLAIRQTVKHIDDSKIALLSGLLAQMREAAEQDNMVQLVTHDLEFHRYLCEWSGRSGLIRAWLPLYNQIQLFVAQTHKKYFSTLMDIAETHQIIIDTLKQKETATAEAVIKDHVMLIWSLIEKQDS